MVDEELTQSPTAVGAHETTSNFRVMGCATLIKSIYLERHFEVELQVNDELGALVIATLIHFFPIVNAAH